MPEAISSDEDGEFDPAVEPDASQAWLNLIDDAEKKFSDYQSKADNIDKLYADLDRQASDVRERQFAMFWANVGVLGPSVYSRTPVPVVVPEFRDRDPLKRITSEILERALIKTYDLGDIDGTMRLVRDDMLIVGRGAPWVRYETKGEVAKDPSTATGERVCIEFLDRKDFLHDPARNWKEVGWVGRRAWMTRKEMRKRFEEHSGDVWNDAAFNVQSDSSAHNAGRPKEASDPREQAGVWEIWSKTHDKVVWVTEGVDVLLDSGKPHLKLEGFFPCPMPAYTTLQRRSLIPVPDFVYYKDQLEEINKLTSRIHALSDSIQVKGFYPAGGEIGDAVETALTMLDDRRVMIPVSNFAAFGSGGDVIVWLPIDMIAKTIAGLIEMRRQVIEDVYQITGLSDIMRGATDPKETLGAQQLKSQYGSIRVRDRQYELVRVAKELTRISAEIMAEYFSKETLLALSQMTVPTRAEIERQVKEIETKVKAGTKQLEVAVKSPQARQLAQQNPEQAQQQAQQLQQQAQQAMSQAAQQIAELETTPTIEDVMELLRDQKLRPFALDIETDSTIQPDEDAEKQRRAEFLQAMGATMQQIAPLVAQAPQAAGFAGEILKFALAPFRVGRDLESSVDEFVEQMQQQAGQGQQESPEAIKAKGEAQRMQGEMQMAQQKAQLEGQVAERKLQYDWQAQQTDMQTKQAAAQASAAEEQRITSAKIADIAVAAQQRAEKHQQDMEKGALELDKLRVTIAGQQQQAQINAASAQQDATIKGDQAEQGAQAADQQADIAERQAQTNERTAEQKVSLAERTAKAKQAEPA